MCVCTHIHTLKAKSLFSCQYPFNIAVGLLVQLVISRSHEENMVSKTPWEFSLYISQKLKLNLGRKGYDNGEKVGPMPGLHLWSQHESFALPWLGHNN